MPRAKSRRGAPDLASLASTEAARAACGAPRCCSKPNKPDKRAVDATLCSGRDSALVHVSGHAEGVAHDARERREQLLQAAILTDDAEQLVVRDEADRGLLTRALDPARG